MGFYDCSRLLSVLDLDGRKPEVFLCTSNRSAGKTTEFSRYIVNRALKYGEKFCLLYRYTGELSTVADQFFGDIQRLFFGGWYMDAVRADKIAPYVNLYLYRVKDGQKVDVVQCGYAVALNGADKLKRYSHHLNDTVRMFFDEFQMESGQYLPDEVDKLYSIHKSIARGAGKHSRYVPVIMAGNPVSIINPYYTAMGISERLDNKTVFLRGRGWVLEQGYNDSAAKEEEESRFNAAFSGCKQAAYSAQGVYLSDTYSMVGKPSVSVRYLCTITDGVKQAGICHGADGIIYVVRGVDPSCKRIYCGKPDQLRPGTALLKADQKAQSVFISAFNAGLVRFGDLICKSLFYNLF